jgi:hypothetical protein
MAIQLQENNGYYTLHMACWKDASLEVLQLLVQTWPSSLTKANNTGMLPLDLAKQLVDGNSPQRKTVQWLEYIINNPVA